MARCSKCGRRAVVKLRYARMNLCAEHFTQYFEKRVKDAIVKYGLVSSGESVLAAVSGGKDSAALLPPLIKAADELGFKVVPTHLDLGLGEYSRECLEAVRRLTRALGVDAVVVDVKAAIGAGVADLAEASGKPPCSVCGVVKRYFLNAAALEWGVDAVATGHHLDDLALYALKNILLGELMGAAKLAPRVEGGEGFLARRVRPLYEVGERECLVYAIVKELPFTRTACPNTYIGSLDATIKQFLLNIDERHPGLKLRFMRSLARLARSLRPSPAAGYGRCPECGMPSRGGVCGFCRLTKSVLGEAAGRRVRNYLRSLRPTLTNPA